MQTSLALLGVETLSVTQGLGLRFFNIIHYLNSYQIPSAVVSMDAKKAFDRTEWEYMFDVMEKFEFGPNFLRWIKLLYKAPSASLLTNGLLSARFSLTRGTAQGSPLSPILFNLDKIQIFRELIVAQNNTKSYFTLTMSF